MSHQSIPKRLDFVTLDVFTTERFKGNPLAIVKVPRNSDLNQNKQQLIAREFNFSETVFLHEREEGTSTWKIDIFTTTAELPFAGHPTVGTLCYIGSTLDSPTQELMLSTKAGPIAARYGSVTQLAEAEIPHNVRIHQSTVSWQQVVESQPSLPQVSDGKENCIWEQWIYSGPDDSDTTFPVVSIVKGMTFVLVGFPSGNFLHEIEKSKLAINQDKSELDRGWSPSFVAPYFYHRSWIRSNEITRIEARMIDPEMGEDPATGSAACALGSYLALQGGEAGKTYRYEIDQGVNMDRDSRIGVTVTLDESGKRVKRVLLAGSAVLVTQGTINI
jgi:PhzF family phenazine biosynthesis protein